jgi:putative ABC transport system permease protein
VIRFDSIRIALGGIAANKLRSALTILMLTIGVAAVIVLVAVGNGSSAAVAAQFNALGTNLLTVSAAPTFTGTGPPTAGTTLTMKDVKALEDKTTNPAVEAVAPVVSASTTLTYGSTTYTPTTFVGTTPAYQGMHGYTMESGTFFTRAEVQSHTRVMVVGTTVVTELFGGATPRGDVVHAGDGTFRVIGVLNPKGTNGTQNLDSVAIAPYTAVQDQIAGYGAFSAIDLEAASAADTTAAESEAEATIETTNKTTAAAPGVNVENQASLLQSSNASNAVLTNLLGAVAGISLLVAGIGVMVIMLVSVIERTREIGIRKTVGARRMDILAQFLAEAVLLCILGGALGVGVGLVISRFRIDGVQPVVAWYSVGLAFGIAVAVGLFFGLYPARRAAGLPPAVALRRD